MGSALYNSVVEVLRMVETAYDGQPSYDWKPAVVGEQYDSNGDLVSVSQIMCRIDMTFMQPSKQIPVVIEAGRAPDRLGVLFCDGWWDIRPGDRLRVVTSPSESTGVVFSIDSRPDTVAAFHDTHHLEVGIREVSPVIAGSADASQYG